MFAIINTSILPPRLPSPDLIGIPLPLGLGDIPADKNEEHGRQRRKNEIHDALAQSLVDQREELGDDERRDPICGEGPALRSTYRLGADELGREDEGHGAQAEREARDEGQDRDGRQDRDGCSDADREQHARRAHAADAGEQDGLAAQDVGEGCEARGCEHVQHADEDVEERRVCGQQVRQQRHAVHDDAVDPAELLRHHHDHHGEDRAAVRRGVENAEDRHGRLFAGSTAALRVGGGEEGLLLLCVDRLDIVLGLVGGAGLDPFGGVVGRASGLTVTVIRSIPACSLFLHIDCLASDL